MQDRPSATELLAAVRTFLETDVVPSLEGRRRFHTLVAANVLAIVERELTGEEARLLTEWTGLSTLLGRTGPPPERLDALRADVRSLATALSERIRSGVADDDGAFRRALHDHLRTTVVAKLRVANPRYVPGAAGDP